MKRLENNNKLERIVEIKLFGEQYRFKAGPEDRHVELVVEFIMNMVEGAKDSMPLPNNDANKFAQLLLATLNICNDFFDLKDKYDDLLKTITERSTKISNKIETIISD